MPFKECSLVMEREEFCRLALTEGANRRELCRRFGISPGIGYKWLDRYREAGLAGLCDRSRRPGSSPGRTAEAMEAKVVAVRGQHPAWGGRKIRRVLQDDGNVQVPSASTITAILRRHGCLDGPGAGETRHWRRFEHAEPNDLWQMDFKGHFAFGSGRCHPLTVLDDHSRYSLGIMACDNERTATVRMHLEKIFERNGLPRRILTDNGSPWGTAGSTERHTVLTVWLMDLGVTVVHGRPYHPQTQGKDERFHRTLKAEVLDGRMFETLAQAQQAFDAWRHIYNTRRPHEALGLAAPATRYRASPRSMPRHVAPPDYEPQAFVRKVRDNGSVAFKNREFKASKAFAGKYVALRATHTDGLFDLCYRSHRLAQIDLRQAVTNPSTISPYTCAP
jgi:transposase InsO family protein